MTRKKTIRNKSLPRTTKHIKSGTKIPVNKAPRGVRHSAKRLARSQRVGAKRSVIRHKRMKARRHAKEVAERRAQRKTMRQVRSMRERYNKMNRSVFRENRTFKRLKPQVEKALKIRNPNYNQRKHIRAVVRDFNSHRTTSFNGSRNIFRSSVKTVYSLENIRHGNKWKPLLNKEIPTPKSVHEAKKFWKSYHKLNDLLEAKHGSKDVFDSDTKLSYLSGHVSGSSEDISHDTFDELIHYAKPSTGIIL